MAIKTDTFTGGGGGAVDSVNGQTGVVVVSGNDIAADHTASNYTAANANVDGHLSGIDTKLGTLATGLTYQGAFNATTGAPSIANASQGDLYVISVAGTIYGQTWAVGDHLLINADMGGSVDNAKIDKIDNTDQVTSVNTQTGAVVLSGDDLAADHSASNYTAANANIDGHLSGIDTKFGTLGTASTAASTDFLQVSNNLSDLNNATTARSNLGLGTAATSASTDFLASTAGLDDLSDVSYTAGVDINNYVLTYDHSTTSWGAEAAATGGLSEIVQDTTPQLGGDLDVNGNSITSAGNANVLINPAGTGDISIGADLIPDADGTHTIGDEDNRYISTYSDLNGAIRFKAKNAQGAQITKGQAVYISGVSGTVPEVQLARANSASTMPAFGLVYATASAAADVEIVTFGNLTDYDTTTYSLSANDTVFISAATAGALTNTAPTGEANLIQNIGRVVRADASAGIIKAGGAGRSNATPNLDDGKIFLGNGSNQAVSTALSAVNLSSFNNDSGFLTNINSESLNDLSDVSYTAGVDIDNYVLTYDHSTTSWGAEAAAGGSEWTIESKDDSGGNFTAQIGYYYLVNNTNTSTPLRMTLPTPSVGDRVRAFNFGVGTLEIRDSGGGSDIDPNDGTVGFQDYKRFDQNCIIDIVCVAAGDYEWVVSPQIEIEGQGSLSTTGQVLYYDASANKNQLQALPYIFPSTDGSASQVLKTDGAGVLTFVDTSTLSTPSSETVAGVIEIATNAEAAAATATDKALVPSNISSLDLADMDNTTSGFIADLVADTSPQLGGSLDVNGQDIVSVSNGDIEIDPNGTGSFKIKGNATSGSGRIVLNCEQNTHGITLKGPPHSAAASYTLTFPNTDGTANQVLKTDGSGGLDWVDQAGGGWTYSAITADPANAQASYHYSCTGTFTITLATSGMNAGEEIRVKNMGTGTVTIDPQTQTIDGSTTDYTMDVQYSAITLVSTGSNWEII